MRPSKPTKRVLFSLAAIGAFLVVARTINPASSSAQAPARPAPMPRRQIGELRGHEFRIVIYSSELGPRYTVISPDGVVLAEDLSDEDVAREFPALQFETLTADAPADDDPVFPDR